MPQNDDFLNAARATVTNAAYNFAANNPTNKIKQIESGVKFSSKKVAVFVSVIDSKLKNQLFSGVIAQPDGSLVTTNFFRDTDGVSLEVEAFISPDQEPHAAPRRHRAERAVRQRHVRHRRRQRGKIDRA